MTRVAERDAGQIPYGDAPGQVSQAVEDLRREVRGKVTVRSDPRDSVLKCLQGPLQKSICFDFAWPGDVDNHRSRPEAREVQAHGLNHLTRSWPAGRVGA